MGHEVFAISSTSGAEHSLASGGSVQRQPTGSEFIVGPENRLLGNIVNRLLKGEGNCYSPVVLCGPAGTGKSHLAHTLAQSRSQVVLVRGADFARELSDAVHTQSMDDFRQRYRTADLLVLDDLQQLVGRHAALQELQHTLDALEAREATVVITSRTVPDQMPDLPPALRSRLNRGLVLLITPPGVAARQHILQSLATERNILLPTDAAKSLAESLSATVSELRGHITKLEMSARTNKEPVKNATTTNSDITANSGDSRPFASIELSAVRQYLSQLHAQRRPTLNQVSTEVAKFYGIKPAAIGSASRRRQLVLARSIAIYLGRTLCGASLKTLGKHFGGRDHTTALHSFRQVHNRLQQDAELSGAVNALQTALTKASLTQTTRTQDAV